LNEIAFHPAFEHTRIEKERRAVLAEVQMMNTIEYRVDCKLLEALHWENALGHRFPIGMEEQIHQWGGDVLKAFHKRWYFPANMTLYIVGDLEQSVEEVEALIEVCMCIPYLPRCPSCASAPSRTSRRKAPSSGSPPPVTTRCATVTSWSCVPPEVCAPWWGVRCTTPATAPCCCAVSF